MLALILKQLNSIKMQNYRGEGKHLDWTNGTGSDVASGAVVVIDGKAYVANGIIKNTEAGILVTEGVFSFAKVNTEAFAVGETLYWDESEAKLTTTSTDNIKMGIAATAELAAATTGEVKLVVSA